LVITAPRRAEIRPLPRPEGPLHVRTIYSGVSLGTELSYFTGTNPMLRARLDPVLGLFHPVDAQQYPITRLGYMEVAKVEHDASALGLAPGTPVAMTYGHRTGWAVDPLAERVVPLPADLDPVLGVLVAHMGPICANGLPGEVSSTSSFRPGTDPSSWPPPSPGWPPRTTRSTCW